MHSIAHLVPAALVELLSTAPLSPGKVGFAWRAAVGPALDRATAARLENGVLIVETTSAQWAREITRSSSIVLGRLQGFLGKDVVTRIEVRSRS